MIQTHLIEKETNFLLHTLCHGITFIFPVTLRIRQLFKDTLQEYGKSTERVYEVVTGNDSGINTMDCAHANYLGHMEFCRSNGLGNVCFGR